MTNQEHQHTIPNLPPPVPYTEDKFLGPELASEIWLTAAAEAKALERWLSSQATPTRVEFCTYMEER